jgi:hypothetical protein
MMFKLITAAALAFGVASGAQAQKVAEYGDPVIGNSYGGCTFTQVYGTGGGGYGYTYQYTDYQITCPSGVYKVGVYSYLDTSGYYGYGSPTCTFYPGSSSYYVTGSCSNWRVYLKP